MRSQRSSFSDGFGRFAAAALALAGGAFPAAAQSSAEPAPLTQPAPMPPVTPAPKDIAFPGVIQLSVDATDLDRHIFRVHEVIPVRGGEPLTLLFPEWIPGDHSPTGPLDELAGLTIFAGGQRVEWVRDPVNVYAFHLTPPAGAATLDIDFQNLSPVAENEGRIVVTPQMLNLEWNAVSLYPAGYFVRGIPVRAQVRLPDGWGFGSALEVASQTGGQVSFKTTPYDVLIDSPIFAGAYFKRVDLDPGAAVPVRLNIVADRPELLEIKPEQLAAHRALVQQASRLYGSHHYGHYDFLLSLTDQMGGVGLEHHQSSENGVRPEYFTDWDKGAPERDLLPHEYTHSWNGKFRRPADLWTADYNTPMRNSLLWVYEGQTQYWGYVLSARSGLWSKDQTLDLLALEAATYDHVPGRAWKALQDTTNDPIVAERRPAPWRAWQRSEDYYIEGVLVWLDADTLIRERSHGRRSLDDFAKAFFGVDNGDFSELTYGFDDVVAALNTVEPYDWAGFLRARLDGHGPGAPLDGLARGGYRLVYTDTPSDFQKQFEALRKSDDYSYSLGLAAGEDGTLKSVLWDGPAFKAGLTVGAKLVAVNGTAYASDRLKAAITAAKTQPGPIELLVRSGDHYRTVRIDYHGGLRFPHLEKTGTGAGSLDAILAARP